MKDLQGKKTTLDDNANIYNRRGNKTEKQKLSEMTFSEKISYINTYYTKTFIVLSIIIIGVIYLIYSMISPKVEDALYAAVINYSIDEETAHELEHNFGEYLKIGEKESINIDTSFFLGESSDASMTAANQMKLTTYLSAQEIDLVIAPESYFENYATNGFFDNLEEQLPTELYTKLADYLYFSTSQENPNEVAYGIYLDHLPYYQERDHEERHIIGLVVNSTKKENGVEFIRYFFGLN